jgi:hypothetical protein
MGGGARAFSGAERGQPVFDEHGHLTPLRHEQLRKRLNATGYWSATLQSELLAQRLGHADEAEIWAILMWNARPGEALTKKLQRWFATGMPLGGVAEESPLARAS